MSSFAVNIALGAALFSVPLVSQAQRNLGASPIGPAVRHDVTLLTGPYLLSPASPPKAPVEGQEWNFIRVGAQSSATPPATGRFYLGPNETRANWATEAELVAAKMKLESANERLKRLQAERAAALERKKSLDTAQEKNLATEQAVQEALDGALAPGRTALPQDPVRFDARMPEAPRLQLSKPAQQATEPKRD